MSHKCTVSLCEEILSKRVTTLEEIRRHWPRPYTRIYFRTIGHERRPIKFAVLSPTQFYPELESALAEADFDGVAIRDPADDEIERFGDFHLAPEWIRWVMPCPDTVEGWIDGVGNSNAKNQLRRKLRAGNSTRAEVAPLNLADYRKWYEVLYVPEILSKPGAIPAWQDVMQFASSNDIAITGPLAGQLVPGFLRIFFFSDADELVGGVLVSTDEQDLTLRVRATAFEPHSRSTKELAVKAMAVLVEEAKSRGYATLSYGDDPNLYGIDVTIGLEHFKASVGMRPIPSRSGTFQLFKIFDGTFRQLRADATQGFYPGTLSFVVAGKGSSRVTAFHRLSATLDAQLSYPEKIAAMRADAAALQVGADQRAPAIKIPRDMQLQRLDCVER